MKRVVSVRMEAQDAHNLKRRAHAMGFTVPEFLTNLARNGENIDQFRDLLKENKEATLKAIGELSREMIKAIQ